MDAIVSSGDTPLVTLRDVGFAYNGRPVLEAITLDIWQGEFLGLIGPNAGGKSTLLKLILGLLEPDSGTISVFGDSPQNGRRHLGYVPQHAAFTRDFPISVEETVMLGRLGLAPMTGRFTQQDHAAAGEVLAAVEIAHLRRRGLHELSGGQLQRVLIARALIAQPRVLLLDEPTANIDMRAEEDIFALLKEYNAHMTIVVVSHDIAFISTYVSRVACLNRRLVCHQTAELDGKLIDQLYGTPVHLINHREHSH